jgi:dolichyl-phosphate-mannose-protein mannosyltransferase
MESRLVRLRQHRSVLSAAALAVVWLGTSGWLALRFAGRIQDWAVMTDELQYAKLATAIGDGSLASIHETYVSSLNQLYPLLLAPFFGALSPPSAFRAAHVLNALVMGSAAFPVYLLGRQVLPRVWSLAVALLSVLVPWMVLTGFLLTEAVAYPVFLWAILALHLAIAAPSDRRDLLAIAALGLAVLARTQFAVLVFALPLAILGHEIGQALATPPRERWWRRVLAGVSEAARRHRLLATLYATGAVVVAVVAVVGSVGSLLGAYSVTVEEGSILPQGVWTAAAQHIDSVAIGCGIAPLILGGGWMLSAIARPRTREEHALATLVLLTTVLLTFEAASYNLRFGGPGVVRDRYLFYVVPLLLVATGAALSGAPRRLVAAGAAVVTVFFAATVPLLEFVVRRGVWVDSPATVLNEPLIEQSGSLGTGTFVALVGLFLGLVLVLGLLLSRNAPLALILAVALLVFSALTLRSATNGVLTSSGLSGRPLAEPPGVVLDWVDSVLPDRATAAIIPFPVTTAWDTTAIRWWDVEFWNRTITQNFVAPDGNFSYTPFPRQALEIDWSTGEVAGTAGAPSYVVAAPHDPRFGLAGRMHAANVELVVMTVDRPYRVTWMTRGLQTDGWTNPGRPATIRVYGQGSSRLELVEVRISMRAPSSASARYRLSTRISTQAGAIGAGGASTRIVRVCTVARSPVDIVLTGWSSGREDKPRLSPEIRGTRHVGVGVGPIAVLPTGRACPPSRR